MVAKGTAAVQTSVKDTYILPYFSVFYMDLFSEGLVFKSLSLDVIRWSVMCFHHMHNQSHEVS